MGKTHNKFPFGKFSWLEFILLHQQGKHLSHCPCKVPNFHNVSLMTFKTDHTCCKIMLHWTQLSRKISATYKISEKLMRTKSEHLSVFRLFWILKWRCLIIYICFCSQCHTESDCYSILLLCGSDPTHDNDVAKPMVAFPTHDNDAARAHSYLKQQKHTVCNQAQHMAMNLSYRCYSLLAQSTNFKWLSFRFSDCTLVQPSLTNFKKENIG